MLNQFNSLIQLFAIESQGLVKLPYLGAAVHMSLDLRLMFPKDAERFTDDDYFFLYDFGGHYAMSFRINNQVRDNQVVGSLNELYQFLGAAATQGSCQASAPEAAPHVEERDLDDEVIAAMKEAADEELDSMMEGLDEESDDEYGDDSEDEDADDEEDIDLDDEDEEEEQVITVSRPGGKPTSKKFKAEVAEMVAQLGELFPDEVGDGDVPEDLLNEVLVTIFEDVVSFDLTTSLTLRTQLEEYVEF